MGITLGDIIIQDDGDIYGEGVNVATRLEQLAEPGGICLSGKVHDEVEGKIAVPLEDRGEYQVKNISRPVRVFAARPSKGATSAGGTASAAFERTASVRIDHKRRVAAAIRDYLARERISREQFAFKTKLGKSTVEKLLIGLFSERTLAIVESHTGLKLREMLESPVTDDAGPAPPAAAGAKALDRPSLAVLPFTNMSGDPEQEYLADGITEDLITALARLRWLFVIARNSSFTYKGKAVDVRQVAQELGVRYVLEGSVRVAGGRMRVTTQLIDAETGKHIWAERYDRELRDLFAVQDEITERVVAAVEPHLYVEEGFRAASKPPDSIDAWGLVARAVGDAEQVRPRAERGGAGAPAPGDRTRADLRARPRRSGLGDLLGDLCLLAAGQRGSPQAGGGACTGRLATGSDRSLGQDGVRALPQLGGAA